MTIALKTALILAFISVLSILFPQGILSSIGLPLFQLESFVRTFAQNMSAIAPWLDLIFHGKVLFVFFVGLVYLGYNYMLFRIAIFVFNFLK